MNLLMLISSNVLSVLALTLNGTQNRADTPSSVDSQCSNTGSVDTSVDGLDPDKVPSHVGINEEHPIPCQYCDKAFSKTAHLRVHELVYFFLSFFFNPAFYVPFRFQILFYCDFCVFFIISILSYFVQYFSASFFPFSCDGTLRKSAYSRRFDSCGRFFF